MKILNKHLLLTIFLSLIVMFSASAIYAGDVNVTDSSDVNLMDDTQEVLSVSDLDASDVSSSNDDVNIGDSSPIPVDTIKSSDVTKYYKGSAKYTVTFTDNNGEALVNTTVKIIVNKVEKTVKTNEKGVVSLDIDLAPGNYNVVAFNPVTDFQLTSSFKILSTIKANDISKVQNDGRKFTATFLNSNGKALANQNVKFKVNGKTYNAKTDKNGVASLSLTGLKAGTYTIISYNADGLTKENTIRVLSSTTTKLNTYSYTFIKKGNKKIKVRLLNGLGYAVSGKVIKITFNGKTYSKKTNANGYAFLSLPKNMNTGIYTVKYNFNGDSVYKKSSSSSKVHVVLSKKSKVVTIKNILDASSRLKSTYAKKGVLPSTINVGGYTLTIHEFYYLMSVATTQMGKSKSTHVTGISDVKAPKSKCSDGVYSAAVTKSKYKAIAKSSINYIKKNKRAPAYVNSVAGKIAYEDYVVMNARVLDYLNKNKEAPNFVSFVSSKKPNYNFKGNNPYGLKGKSVWIDADGGSDAIKWQLANALKKLGWEVHVGGTYANAHYEDYFNAHPGCVLITIYNGFCAGTIRELASSSVQDLLKTKNVVCVPIWHTAGWNGGMKAYKYGDFSGYSAQRAWDDDFSSTNPAITNVEEFLKVNNIKYCAAPTCDLIVKQFLKGGCS